MKKEEKKNKTNFNSKDLKFEVGDIIYSIDKDTGSDYSIKQLFIEQFKITKIEITIDRIYYYTTTECTIEQTINNNNIEKYSKSKDYIIKQFLKEFDIYFNENGN